MYTALVPSGTNYPVNLIVDARDAFLLSEAKPSKKHNHSNVQNACSGFMRVAEWSQATGSR